MQQVYLSRRNLLTLLSKLDRKANGESTACTLMKCDKSHPDFPCSDVTLVTAVEVTAVEDADYYTDRSPGVVHPNDDPALNSKHVSDR